MWVTVAVRRFTLCDLRRSNDNNPLYVIQFCLEEEDVWRCVLAWAKHKSGVTQPTSHWSEDERALVCQHLDGVISHVRLLLIGLYHDNKKSHFIPI